MAEIDYTKVSELDPLDIDSDIYDLATYNERANVALISKLGDKAIRNLHLSGIENVASAYAILRDLDFIASSLDRHGLNPFQEVVGLEDAMVVAGLDADSIPRGTITTYAGVNPYGPRRRSFTGSPEEDIFIDSLKVSFDELEIAMNGLARLTAFSDSSEVVHSLDTGTSAMSTMTNSTVSVMRNVSPEVFSGQIRPYFEPIYIGGEQFVAANGSQLQLVGIEKLVYGEDAFDSTVHTFYEENFPYLNSAQRQQLEAFQVSNHGMDIVTMTEKRRDSGEDVSDIVTSLSSLTKMIKKFRYPHRKVAEDNFKIRPDGSVGSGSFTPAILTDLIHASEARITHIEEISA